MKTITLLMILLLAASITQAQDTDYYNNDIQTIFSGRRNNGGYGAISFGYSKIDNSDAFVGGVRGGFIFDHKFAIGLAGYGFINNLDDHHYHDPIKDDYYLAGGYGGLLLEPIIAGKSPVHVSVPVILGIGGVSQIDGYWDWDWDDEGHYHEIGSDLIFVFEPGIDLEFNLARHFRLAASASYRLTSDIELYATDADALRGFQFGLTFKFGKF